jgi:7,8-dihydropterin-6-yl-methyl-4-(beta-D-ribofuranosyl)aminobenzene 5'-phosphate synthase
LEVFMVGSDDRGTISSEIGIAVDEIVPLVPVDEVKITLLMENISDLLLPTTEGIERASLAGLPSITVPTFDRPGPEALIAEHGFSALVEVTKDGATRQVLFDTGISPNGVTENMRRLDVDAKDVSAVVMSHGHLDHAGGLGGFIREVGRRNLPVLLHPDFWLKRRLVPPGGEPWELPTTSRSALEGAGFEIVEAKPPSFLLDHSLLVTGQVDRTTPFEQGFPIHEAERNGAWTPDPLILDEQAVVIDVRGLGLVVLTGCGHAGIVNIVRYAQQLTGVDRVHAVIGGFHLTGGLFEPIIGPTVDALAELDPGVLMPGHCSGWRAQAELARRLPEAYVHPSVGTKLTFNSAVMAHRR